eukprot:s257_g28.t1
MWLACNCSGNFLYAIALILTSPPLSMIAAQLSHCIVAGYAMAMKQSHCLGGARAFLWSLLVGTQCVAGLAHSMRGAKSPGTYEILTWRDCSIVQDHCFDEGREWRVFASEGVDSQVNSGRERADVSSTIDQGTSEGGGTLIVGAGPKAQRLQMKLRSAQNANKPEPMSPDSS